MKKIVTICIVSLLMLSAVLLSGCGQNDAAMKDGYYSAEMSDYSHGWKEYITICVSGGKVVSAEYNARNASGFIKSWDMAYMRLMNMIAGTYPNRYTRTYAGELLAEQSAGDIDAISGASHSYETFTQLAAAVLEHAQNGDMSIAIVQSADE